MNALASRRLGGDGGRRRRGLGFIGRAQRKRPHHQGSPSAARVARHLRRAFPMSTPLSRPPSVASSRPVRIRAQAAPPSPSPRPSVPGSPTAPPRHGSRRAADAAASSSAAEGIIKIVQERRGCAADVAQASSGGGTRQGAKRPGPPRRDAAALVAVWIIVSVPRAASRDSILLMERHGGCHQRDVVVARGESRWRVPPWPRRAGAVLPSAARTGPRWRR